MHISEKALTKIESDPNLAKYSTEYFVYVDSEDMEAVSDIVKKHQFHLPTLLTQLKRKGYKLESQILKNGRVLLHPKKTMNSFYDKLDELVFSLWMVIILFGPFLLMLIIVLKIFGFFN